MRTRPMLLLGVTGALVAAAAYVGLRPFQALPEPTPLLSAAVDSAEELARWRDATVQLRQNRYAPEVVREATSVLDVHKAAVRFLHFVKAREAVQQGSADYARMAAYHAEVIYDLEQRVAVLTFLRPDRMVSSSSKATALRGMINRQDLARLRAAILEHRAINETLTPDARSPESAPSTRRRVLCFVESTGIVYCVLEQRLIDMTLAGYWNGTVWETLYFDEAHAYDVIRRIDEVMRWHRLDVRHNTLIACSSGKWWSADTHGPKVGSPEGITPHDLPSIREMELIARACRSISTVPSVQPVAGLKGATSRLATETVARIDARVENCTQSDGRVSAGGSLGDQVRPTWLGLFAWVNTPRGDAGPDFKAEAEQRAREELAREARENERAITILTEAAEKLEKEADELQKQADEEADAAKNAEAEKKRQQAAAFRNEAECRSKSGKSCADIAAEKKKAEESTDQSDQGGQQGQLDGVNYSTCASLKASWEWFKAECDRTGSWDRPGSECNEMLRRENGCVSTTVITPNPEGDNTCVRGTISEEEAWRRGCEERQKVMSVAEMLQNNCGFHNRPVFDTRLADPCNDPAAMPSPETTCSRPSQSTPPGVRPVRGGQPIPMPYGDFVATSGGIVFDALRFEGLGLTQTLRR